jgi:hypothetical protein
MTFAMARHAAVDLALVFNSPPHPPDPDRLPPERLEELDRLLSEGGLGVTRTPEADAKLKKLRGLYEPYVNSLSEILVLALPAWMPNPDLPDNWQTSAWDRNDHFFQFTADELDEEERGGRNGRPALLAARRPRRAR